MDYATEYNATCVRLGLTGRGDGVRWGQLRGHPIAVFTKVVSVRAEHGVPGSVMVSATIQVGHSLIEPPREEPIAAEWGTRITRGDAKVVVGTH